MKISEDRLKEIIEEEILNYLEEKKKKKKKKKKRKLTAKPGSETSLRDWFGRKGAKGKKGGCGCCSPFAPDSRWAWLGPKCWPWPATSVR